MRLLRYFLVGGTAACVDLLGFGALLRLTHGHWFESAAASFVLATAVNYVLSIRFVFQSRVRFGRMQEVGLVFVVSFLGLVVNQAFLWFFFKAMGQNVWLSKVLAIATVFAWNFSARNFFVFKGRG